MAAIRATTSMIVRDIFHPSLSLASLPMFRSMLPSFGINLRLVSRAMMISYSPAVRCAAGEGGRTKASSRLSQIQQILHEAQERALSAGNEPIPKITIAMLTEEAKRLEAEAIKGSESSSVSPRNVSSHGHRGSGSFGRRDMYSHAESVSMRNVAGPGSRSRRGS